MPKPKLWKKPRPNILIIYVDDLAWGDVGAFGCPDTGTPNIDRLPLVAKGAIDRFFFGIIAFGEVPLVRAEVWIRNVLIRTQFEIAHQAGRPGVADCDGVRHYRAPDADRLPAIRSGFVFAPRFVAGVCHVEFAILIGDRKAFDDVGFVGRKGHVAAEYVVKLEGLRLAIRLGGGGRGEKRHGEHGSDGADGGFHGMDWYSMILYGL